VNGELAFEVNMVNTRGVENWETDVVADWGVVNREVYQDVN
jgi:hypothetical protein